MKSQTRTLIAALAVLSLVAGPAAAAKGEKAPKAGAKAAPVKLSAEALAAADLLKSGDEDQILAGVKKLGELAEPGASKPLMVLLESGPKDKITEAALDALGAISNPDSIPVLIEYMGHRRAKVRVVAVNAIAEIKDKKVVEALKSALGDSDETVRKAAAYALGRYGDPSAIDILFKAFDRNVPEAAIAIGQLGGVDAMERLAGYLGKSPLDILKPGFSEFLNRADFPLKGKLAIIDKLMELAGPEIKEFLKQYASGLPAETDIKLKQKVQEAIDAIAD